MATARARATSRDIYSAMSAAAFKLPRVFDTNAGHAARHAHLFDGWTHRGGTRIGRGSEAEAQAEGAPERRKSDSGALRRREGVTRRPNSTYLSAWESLGPTANELFTSTS